ncbi:sulfhydryl oxidase 1-like [Patiria miniata]|uniref:Sulfhydryl oxidase n=1 Tax=Patiria miniata TaxID=46514 RepID=A0A913Z3R0_PATMI|nr:sulfhydryl oxidase 1-like [Patiria miniata]
MKMEAQHCIWIVFYLLAIENWPCNSVNMGSTSLYDPSDDVSVLNNSTLKGAIFGSKQAWFVQFYSSWCGHCVHFAPTWKEFAGDIKGWQSIAKVAALNCADQNNNKICSQYIDTGFPTLRLFNALQKNGTGDVYKGSRDVTSLRHALIEHISKQISSQNAPPHWPMLSPVSVQWLLTFYSRNVKPKMKIVAIVFEDADSYTGRELILDMSNTKEVLVVRVLQEELLRNPLPPEWNVGELPSLLILKRNGHPSVLWRSGNRESFFKALQEYIQKTLPASDITGGSLSKTGQRPETLKVQKETSYITNGSHIDGTKAGQHQGKTQAKPIANDTSGKTAARSVVYMEDLESTLIYSLKYEVGLQKEIGADAMGALQAYIAVLNKYFPGRPDVMNTLKQLQRLLQPYTQLTSDDWSNVMNRLQTSQDPGYFLQNEVTWVGCQGSTQVYRGYPCGLWVLFHTLTVSHARLDSHYRKSDSKEVLHAMKGYIHYFFGCRACSENFAKESVHLESSVSTLDDSVLWLWQVHNSVNKRLAGDLSEDPQHPKIAFPSYSDCPTCHNVNSPRRWKNTRILQFLKELYGVNNIDFAVSGVRSKAHELITAETLKRLNVGATVSYGYARLGIDTRDVSMCVLLYALCSVLLVVIFIYVKRRRRRKLFQNKYGV